MRKGSAGSARGVVRFVDERRRQPATRRGHRADHRTRRLGVLVPQADRPPRRPERQVVDHRRARCCSRSDPAIGDNAWADIAYTQGGRAQVAETQYVTGRGKAKRTVRLVVRRTRLAQGTQQQMWPDWRHHAFITNTDHDTLRR